MQKYFLGLKSTMPSMSPIDKNWPARPYIFLDGVHTALRRIFHLWRCKKYRSQFTEEKKAVYEEKLEASEIFKDKKALYPSSVSQPFKGDYLEISRTPNIRNSTALWMRRFYWLMWSTRLTGPTARVQLESSC